MGHYYADITASTILGELPPQDFETWLQSCTNLATMWGWALMLGKWVLSQQTQKKHLKQGHCHVKTWKGLPQTVARTPEAHCCLKYHSITLGIPLIETKQHKPIGLCQLSTVKSGGRVDREKNSSLCFAWLRINITFSKESPYRSLYCGLFMPGNIHCRCWQVFRNHPSVK